MKRMKRRIRAFLREKTGHSDYRVSENISKKVVKNKNTAARSSRASKTKTKKPSSKTASRKVPAPLGDSANRDSPAGSPELQAAGDGQQRGKVYVLASVIFQNNHVEKSASRRLLNYGKDRGLPLPEVKNADVQRTAYELAFNALKYQELLEDIVVDSGLYLTEPLPDDQMGLFAVMLYDFQDRKFLPWEHQEGEVEIIQKVRDVEKYLLKFKTKLAASLARCRIKQNILSIHCVLPDSVKMKQERSSSLLVYAWINTLKSSCDEVKSVLKSAGFSQVKSVEQLEGQSFCEDTHCRDILVFPALLKAQLHSTKLLIDHKLIIQDKACSLGPYLVHSVLPDEGDVLMVGCFSGLTVSHTASLIAEKQKSNHTKNKNMIYVCVSNRTDSQKEKIQQAVTAMGCKNVMLITEVFQSLNGGDKRLQKVRVILLTPKCSLSAVSNPVDFILQENGDTDLFQDLSQGSVAQSKLEALVAQQTKDIDHALKFPKLLALVYSTCSSYPEENEGVVSRALVQAKVRSVQEGDPKQGNFRVSAHLRQEAKATENIIKGAILCLNAVKRPYLHLFNSPNYTENSTGVHPYFILEPSEHNNGCFLAVLTREPVPVVSKVPQEVLARANAKGILDKLKCNQPTRKEHHKHTNRITKTFHAQISQPQFSVSIQSKNQEIKISNSTTIKNQYQEFSKRHQSTQGKELHLQGLNITVPTSFYCRQGNTILYSKNSSPTKINTTTTTTLHPALPPAISVVRPRKAHKEELKPVVLSLPPVHFPDLFPPRYLRTGFNPSFSYSKWRTPSHHVATSIGGISNDIRVKPWPSF